MPVQSAILLHEREYFIRVAGGDQQAFSVIFYHYTGRIHPFIKKITRSEEVTREIIQDVFLSLWNKRESLLEIDNYAGYIFTIATNKTFNYLKYQARKEKNLHRFAQTEKDYTNNTLETIDMHLTRELVSELVMKLPPQKKLIYKLTREDGLSHDEIAEQLHISKNTVKNHLVETLKFLRQHLQATEAVSLLLVQALMEIYF